MTIMVGSGGGYQQSGSGTGSVVVAMADNTTGIELRRQEEDSIKQ